MHDTVRVVVLGTGQMGSGMIKLLRQKQGVELVGVFGRRGQRAGMDVGEAVGLGHQIGLKVSHDLPALLRQTQPHLALHATCSRVDQAFEELLTLLQHGTHIITIAEEMAYPRSQFPKQSKTIHDLAVAQHVTVLGTGINPGFVLDLLVIALTGVCFRVESIHARRVNDLAPYGPSVLASQGVGLTRQDFMRGLETGEVVGHVGFPESIHMIAGALGWRVDRIEQQRQPIISRVKRQTPFVTVEPGCTAGCTHTAVAYRDEAPVIRLVHPQQVHPHLENVATGDYIDINGEPNLHVSASPEIPGGIGTVALAVNMIAQVMNATPGLKSMRDLPVPAAIMGDVRSLLHQENNA